MNPHDFTVIEDTREQQPWDFSYFPGFLGLDRRKLDTGDYSLVGYEHLLTIERKKTTGEISLNLGQKVKQFEAEFERMIPIKYKYVVCEFTLDDVYSFPVNSGIPKSKHKFIRMNGNYLAMKLQMLTSKYKVELIFAANKNEAELIVNDIFQKVINDTKLQRPK